MENLSHTAQIETQVVETGKLIFLSILLGDIVAQSLCLDEPETSEIEVIPQTTLLIINHRMLFQFTRYFSESDASASEDAFSEDASSFTSE